MDRNFQKKFPNCTLVSANDLKGLHIHSYHNGYRTSHATRRAQPTWSALRGAGGSSPHAAICAEHRTQTRFRRRASGSIRPTAAQRGVRGRGPRHARGAVCGAGGLDLPTQSGARVSSRTEPSLHPYTRPMRECTPLSLSICASTSKKKSFRRSLIWFLVGSSVRHFPLFPRV